MAERVDVLIAGSGFGGSITAFRLGELYKAAGVDPKAIVVLERGARYKHTQFKQSMHIDHLSSVYNLIQGQGAQVVTANAVGGGSNLYLAASLRSPSETFERRDRGPGDGPERRMWPAGISRRTLDPYYRRAEHGLRVNRPTWDQVSKSGGLWAATLARGRAHLRPGAARDQPGALRERQVVPHRLHLRREELADHQLPAQRRAHGRADPAELPGRVGPPVLGAAVPLHRHGLADGQRGREPVAPAEGATIEIECKVLVLATGAMGNAPILMRSQNDLPALSDQVGKHLGVNGDHVAAIEYDPRKVRDVLGLPGYDEFYKGKPITTMTYDFWVGRRDHRYDGTRFNLQEIFLSSLTNFLYDDGRAPAGDPSWWGLQKKDAIAHWANRIELLAMVEDTHDGQFYSAPPGSGGATRPNAGPVEVGTFTYALSEPVDPGPRGGRRGDEGDRRAPRPRPLHGAHRDAGRLRVAPARRLPDGGDARPRRGRRHRRRVRLRGPVLHRLLDHPDVAGRQPVADDRGRVRALRRRARRARRRPRPAGTAGGASGPDPGARSSATAWWPQRARRRRARRAPSPCPRRGVRPPDGAPAATVAPSPR